MALFNPTRPIHGVKKGPWSEMEDKRLLDLVNYFGAESWMDISKEHGSRNAKQCRERYHQNLKSSINRGPITGEEGVAIERYYAEKGPKWAEIARALGGRSDNQVKNWYNGQKNRRTKITAHNCPSMLRGTIPQPPLSAVRSVDVQLLQQRGHTNPQPQKHHDHQSKPSPTTSQISEAPSLISDASSTSSGISPSPNSAHPIQHKLASSILSSWNENSARPILPPLCTPGPPSHPSDANRMAIIVPPVLPPPNQPGPETNQCHEAHNLYNGPDTFESRRRARLPLSSQLLFKDRPPSPQARRSSFGLNQPDQIPSHPGDRPYSQIYFPSNEQAASYSLLELSIPSKTSYTPRLSQPPQSRAAPSRKSRAPNRFMPYPSSHPFPISPGGSERSAQDRMKLDNILEQ